MGVDVLRAIDPQKKIDFPFRPRQMKYTEDEMRRDRLAYGVPGK